MKIVKIKTYHDPKVCKKAAELYAKEEMIAIGYIDAGNIDELTQKQIESFLIDKKNYSKQKASPVAKTLVQFRDDIEKGDFIFAYNGANEVALVGTVRDKWNYNDENIIGNLEGEIQYPNQRLVDWWEAPRNFNRYYLPEDLADLLGRRGTINIFEYDIELEDLKKKLNEILSKEALKNILKAKDEEEIKAYIRNRPQDFEDGLEEVIDFGEGIEPEAQTTVGDMDFFAYDSDLLHLIIEVKKGAKDNAIGQLLGYISAYKEENDVDDVRGILIAEEFTNRVKKAAKEVGIELIKCEKRFLFSKLEEEEENGY